MSMVYGLKEDDGNSKPMSLNKEGDLKVVIHNSFVGSVRKTLSANVAERITFNENATVIEIQNHSDSFNIYVCFTGDDATVDGTNTVMIPPNNCWEKVMDVISCSIICEDSALVQVIGVK